MRRQADEWSLLSVISDVVATRKGAGYGMNSHTSAFATSWLDRCLESGHPCGCSHAADGRLSNASALEANCHNKMLRSHHRPFDGWRTDPSHMTDGEVFYSKETLRDFDTPSRWYLCSRIREVWSPPAVDRGESDQPFRHSEPMDLRAEGEAKG